MIISSKGNLSFYTPDNFDIRIMGRTMAGGRTASKQCPLSKSNSFYPIFTKLAVLLPSMETLLWTVIVITTFKVK